MFNLTAFNFISAVLLGLTIWVGVSRFTSKLENNWPLFYYVFLVLYLKTFDRALDPYTIYVGVVSALFLRFEFMGGWFLKFVRTVEMAVLGYVVYRCFMLIVMW